MDAEMDMTIDWRTASYEELLKAVLDEIARRARLTPAQKAAHGKRHIDDLRGHVLYMQAIEGAAPGDRRAIHDDLVAEGRLVLRGKGMSRCYHAVV